METFDSFMKAPWAPIVVMVIIIAIVIIVNAVGNSRKKKQEKTMDRLVPLSKKSKKEQNVIEYPWGNHNSVRRYYDV